MGLLRLRSRPGTARAEKGGTRPALGPRLPRPRSLKPSYAAPRNLKTEKRQKFLLQNQGGSRQRGATAPAGADGPANPGNEITPLPASGDATGEAAPHLLVCTPPCAQADAGGNSRAPGGGVLGLQPPPTRVHYARESNFCVRFLRFQV